MDITGTPPEWPSIVEAKGRVSQSQDMRTAVRPGQFMAQKHVAAHSCEPRQVHHQTSRMIKSLNQDCFLVVLGR